MAYFVYILQSTSTGPYYCGYTDDLARRLRQHNDPEYRGSTTTKRFPVPWLLIWQKEFSSRDEAMMKEKRIKSRGIQRYLAAQPVESRPGRD